MKKFLKRVFRKIRGKMSTEDLNDYLKKHDISIGQKTVFFAKLQGAA